MEISPRVKRDQEIETWRDKLEGEEGAFGSK